MNGFLNSTAATRRQMKDSICLCQLQLRRNKNNHFTVLTGIHHQFYTSVLLQGDNVPHCVIHLFLQQRQSAPEMQIIEATVKKTKHSAWQQQY